MVMTAKYIDYCVQCNQEVCKYIKQDPIDLFIPELNPGQKKWLLNILLDDGVESDINTNELVQQGKRDQAKIAFGVNAEKEKIRERIRHIFGIEIKQKEVEEWWK